MKRGIWVAVAVAVAVAGAWGYGALMRQENDDGRRVQLLAIAEEQHTDLSFSRSGRRDARARRRGDRRGQCRGAHRRGRPLRRRLGPRAPARSGRRPGESPARTGRAAPAQLAQTASEESRRARLASEGVAPAADLETLQHKRGSRREHPRAGEAEKGNLEAQERSLTSRLEKVHRFENEGTLTTLVGGTVLTRYHRQGEFVTAGDPVVTLQVEAPDPRVEVPEERLSAFTVGGSVTVWPQARPTPASRRASSRSSRGPSSPRERTGASRAAT